MKYFYIFLFIFIIIGGFAFKNKDTNKHMSLENQSFAIIELFTSQGCSSCPAADELLAKTIDNHKDNNKLIAISYHVDYWNRLGWKDLLSKKEFSDRQRAYGNIMNLNSIYTPQMIVNGEKEFIGSNENDLKYALRDTKKSKEKVTFKNLSATINGRNVTTEFQLNGEYQDCKVNIVLISKKETTEIFAGENKGKTLTYRNVVRYMHSLNAEESGKITFNTNIDLNLLKENFFIVAFVQDINTMKIIGADSFSF